MFSVNTRKNQPRKSRNIRNHYEGYEGYELKKVSMYKYSLDKSSRKFICPNCQKKTFVRYYDNENQVYTDHQFGRCDRESKCAYHYKPTKNDTIKNYYPSYNTTPKKQSFIEINEVSKHGNNFKNNNFIQFLKKHFKIEEIKTAILNYLIGTSSHWQGATVFWQIDNQNKVYTGKIMLYDKGKGKRVKTPFNHISWMHKVLKIENFELNQCLFGLHLINELEVKTVAIVESEKTAVMMSLFLPEYLWLATGSKTNFKKEILNPVKNYIIIAFPDKTEYASWKKTADALNKDGFTIFCSTILESKNYPEGFDLADVYIQNKSKVVLTENEKIFNRFKSINPIINDLVDVFDLVY